MLFSQKRLNQVVVHFQPVDLIPVIFLHLPVGFVVPHIEQVNEPNDRCQERKGIDDLTLRRAHAKSNGSKRRQDSEPQRGPPNLDHDVVDRAEEENLTMEDRWNVIVEDVEVKLPRIRLLHHGKIRHSARFRLQIETWLVLLECLPSLCALFRVKRQAGNQSNAREYEQELESLEVHVSAEGFGHCPCQAHQ